MNISSHRLRRGPLAAALAVAILTLSLTACLRPLTGGGLPPDDPSVPKPTIVLVHGAWADGSGWNGVASRLHSAGYPVLTVANPLRSLDGDSAYLASILAQTPGPIVLVGHSYGGAVITNAADGNANVKALVYISAFIPDVGEDVLHLSGAGSQVPTSIEFKGFPPFSETDVDIYINADKFRDTLAGDVRAKDAALLAAAQRPLAFAAGGSPTTATAWKTIPSWALIGQQDKTIDPAQQRFMTQRAGSTTVEINSSHVSLISNPRPVTDVILQAARATD